MLYFLEVRVWKEGLATFSFNGWNQNAGHAPLPSRVLDSFWNLLRGWKILKSLCLSSCFSVRGYELTQSLTEHFSSSETRYWHGFHQLSLGSPFNFGVTLELWISGWCILGRTNRSKFVTADLQNIIYFHRSLIFTQIVREMHQPMFVWYNMTFHTKVRK